MADTAARLALSARRNEVARFTIAVTGIDLTGVALAMQVRETVDNPYLLFALGTVSTLAAEGLKLDSVTVVNGVPTSIIKGRINASTMTDASKVPYMGEIGENSPLAYAMQWTLNGDAQTRIYGDFIVVGSAFGSDGAPTNRPPSYGSQSFSSRSTGGSLTFGDQVISISLSDTALLGPLVAQAQTAVGSAQQFAIQSGQSSANSGASAAASAQSANYAEEFSGPAYDTVAAGQAATATGKFFRVSNGDTPRTYARYQRTAGGSVLASSLAPSAALAAPTGGELIGLSDGATLKQALAFASTAAAFLASTALAPVGATVRTIDGYSYTALPTDAGAPFLQRADGAKFAIPDNTVDIVQFGAKFDLSKVASAADATDDSNAWEKALAYLAAIGGGTLTLPKGASKLTRVIDIPINVPIRIRGTGTQKVYPGNYVAGTKCPSTAVGVHTGRATFRFKATANGQGGFVGENWNINAIVTGDVPDCGFGWEVAGSFAYGFTFRQMGIHNLRKTGAGGAFEIYKTSGAELSAGAVLVEDCTINHNGWIQRCLNGCNFNSWRFVFNKAGQNGYPVGTGGIDISGHNITIDNNILEGQRDPVKISGGYRMASVRGNYFEANVGIACVNLASSFSFVVGPNFFGALDPAALTHKVLISYTGLGVCHDPYWPTGTSKMPPPLLGTSAESSLNNAADSAYHRIDRFDGANYSARPNMLAQFNARVSAPVRDLSPQTGKPIPVQEYTTTGTGLMTLTQTIAGASGQWVVTCLAFKRVADAVAATEPYVTINVNNSGGSGSRDFPCANFARWWREGDWIILTMATKLGVAMTSLGVGFYPFGLNPVAGRVARFLRPYTYVVDDINKVVPFMDNSIVESTVAAPTTGTWVAGDMLARAAGGFFVCTASGSPGTWGTIAPA